MTLEEFNTEIEKFLLFYKDLFRRAFPNTFDKFLLYSAKDKWSFEVIIFSVLKDGNENRIYRCDTIRPNIGPLAEAEAEDETIKRTYDFIKESFAESLIFSKDIAKLIHEGNNY